MPLSSTSCFPASAVAAQQSLLLVGAGWLYWPVSAFTSESQLRALTGWHGCSKGFCYLEHLPLVHFSASPLPFPALGCCPPTMAVSLTGTPLTPSYEPHYFCSMSQVLKTRYVHLVDWWLRHPLCSRWKENAQDGVIIIYVISSLGSFAMYMLKQRCFFRRNVYAKLNLSHQKQILKLQSRLEIKQISICWWVVEFVIQTSDCNL